jgi:hypothetical protein
LYVLNPFVYGRLHYGQVGLLAGYAILPWVAARLRYLLLAPGVKTALITALSLVLLGIMDLHLLLPAALLTIALVSAHVVIDGHDRAYLTRLGRYFTLAIVVASVASAYWLVPVLAGFGSQALTVARIGEGDLVVFRTTADPHLGLLPNTLGLYGFWAEDTHRFPSMKDFVPYWPVSLASLLLLAALGAGALLRGKVAPAFMGARAWGVSIVVAGVVSAVLAIGVADSHIAPIIQWLDRTLPVYRGMRDAGKWSVLLALAYSQLVPVGAVLAINWIRVRLRTGRIRELGEGLAIGLALAIPMYYGNGLLFGMHGQVQPSEYPQGWYAADHDLHADGGSGRALFLPWHEYLHLSFVRNVNAVIACPAPGFFSIAVLSSLDPQTPGLKAPDSPDQTSVDALLREGSHGQWAATLAERNVEYILLARESDWRSYRFLDNEAAIVKVGDYDSIVLYRNLAWHD